MTNIKNYGQRAELACKNTEGYKAAIKELYSILTNSKCEGSKIAPIGDGFGHIYDEIANNYYTFPPFVDTVDLISNLDYESAIASDLCPKGYAASGYLQISESTTIVTCKGIIDNATAGEYISGYCAALYGSTTEV